MDSSTHVSLQASDRSYLAIIKKEIHRLAAQLEFSPKRLAEIDIVVAEIASNLVKHAGGGEILIRVFQEQETAGIELISIDNGPGMKDPARMMQDGVSTTSTLGQGLGAIKRLSDQFQLYSLANWGTILLARIFRNDVTYGPLQHKAEIRSVVVAKPGQTECGDGFCAKTSSSHLKLFLGDGLGHGPEAQAAVQEAIRSFRLNPDISPVEIIRSMHRSVKRTRGLVGMVAVLDLKNKLWKVCGVGNISARIVGNSVSKNPISYNGIIGLNLPNSMNNLEWNHDNGQLLMMGSDGLRSRWDLARYPAITKYDLSILAAALYKDYSRRTDDTSIVVARIK